ncbi:hypothetical protein [Novosphingobium sp. CECT 9465]|uniref:hypothetical protein n=1 Tax=Novosphingobium sp. CECT 9465 TaxID=2829794 RepID=UPI001E28A316|nr:hypothetical protein [Novosphingobium sp. CECT 9465]CAH0496526.1 hypothetical protein NVSP9465_01561 [Novosphingobium sp. CECT 9465]
MRKLITAAAAGIAVLGWSGMAVANPDPHPAPAPKDGEHKKDEKADDHKDEHKDDHHTPPAH